MCVVAGVAADLNMATDWNHGHSAAPGASTSPAHTLMDSDDYGPQTTHMYGPRPLTIEIDEESDEGWSEDESMDLLDGLATSLGSLQMAAAAPSRLMVKVRINDKTELGVLVQLADERWTVQELVQQVRS